MNTEIHNNQIQVIVRPHAEVPLPAQTPQATASTPAVSAATAPTPREAIPSPLRQRKMRADSFAAQLTMDQRLTLCRWFSEEPITAHIQKKIAAPPPEGFGLNVHHQTLERLRTRFKNLQLEDWIEKAMDAACDVLHSESAADVAPLRETLLLILYSRAMSYARKDFLPGDMDRFVSAIARLEKVKALTTRAPGSRDSIPTGRIKVDLNIQHAQVAPAPSGNPQPVLVSAAPIPQLP